MAENDISGLELSGQQFEKLVKLLQDREPSSNFYTVYNNELLRAVCPLAAREKEYLKVAARCLTAGSREKRRELCDQRSCPIQGFDPIAVNVFRNGVFRGTREVDPGTGKAHLKAICEGVAKNPRPRRHYVQPEDREGSLSEALGKGPLAVALTGILWSEYAPHLRLSGIAVPHNPTVEFIVNNTEFRFLTIPAVPEPVPVDPWTIDLTCNAYLGRVLRPEYLAKQAGCTIIEAVHRLPFVEPLVDDINSHRFPVVRYHDLLVEFNSL